MMMAKNWKWLKKDENEDKSVFFLKNIRVSFENKWEM